MSLRLIVAIRLQKYALFLFSPNFFRIFAAVNIQPIAYFHSPLTSKFGIPRQSGLAKGLSGHIVFTPEYRREEAVRGLDGFDFLWLIWEFSLSPDPSPVGRGALTVRPPRLGGNERVGVFASRSPFRPNNLGLSCVRLDRVQLTQDQGPVIHVLGADLMDGTPIYDIKPYVAYADGALCEVLAQDPRPRYHDNPTRVYGMPFAGRDVKFRVADGIVRVVGVE